MEVTAEALQSYRHWRQQSALPPELAAELQRLSPDSAELQDRFGHDLDFGTGGLRAVMGVGSNRINRITIRRATAGLAAYLLAGGFAPMPGAATDGVVIGFDCRRLSAEFAQEAAAVLAAAGVQVWLFRQLCPTPQVSFAIRHVRAAAGIMVTASHNPPEYNGYKVYDANGGQILPDVAAAVVAAMEQVADPFAVPVADAQVAIGDGRIRLLGDDLTTAYVDAVVGAGAMPSLTAADRAELHVVYTPLHGTGNQAVRAALAAAGYRSVATVASQERPDGEFPTVHSPNPEEPEALHAAIELAKRTAADVVLGTDPDADRVGVAVRAAGTGTGAGTGAGAAADAGYVLLTGNQVGGLLVDFVLQMCRAQAGLPGNGAVVKTVVTSDFGAALAEREGVRVVQTLTGFKYIGALASAWEQDGSATFLLGYEESYGYLATPLSRDKDAVQACLLICEMASWHRRQGRTLATVLEQLYQRVGHYAERLRSVTLPGAQGTVRMQQLMCTLRQGATLPPGLILAAREDYARQVRQTADGREEALAFPVSDVLKYLFTDGSWVAVRPSGTEPKIKFYLASRGHSKAESERILTVLDDWVSTLITPLTDPD